MSFGQLMTKKRKPMGAVLATKGTQRERPTGWIWRMMLGVGLIGLSLWGIGLCQSLFRTFMGKNPSPVDATFAKLAAEVAWLVFFGPIAVAGLAVLWSMLRKVGALDWLETLRERATASNDDQLEGLSEEETARLIKRGHQIAVLLGLAAGTFLILIGALGLILVSSPSAPFSFTVWFGVASGVSILTGLAILQRTLRKEKNVWLLPLRVFTRLVLRRHSLSTRDDKPRRSEHVR